MRFSCLLPIDEGQGREFGTIDAIAAMAAAMDQAGVDAGSVTDHPAPSSRWLAGGGHPTLDPFVALTALASASSRLMLHTHILVLAYRNPFVVAKSAASLDALSQGRFIMGIGTGYSKPEYAAVGVPFEDRGAITDESIAILRAAWTGEPVVHESPRFFARDAVVLPRPHHGDIPIWAGGNAKRAIRRAVELCEGWCPFPASGVLTKTARTDELATVDQLRDLLAYARAHGEAVGRTRPLTVCMGRLGDGRLVPGDAASAARAVEDYLELAALGVSWTTIGVPAPSLPAFIDNLAWFGSEVIAPVRKALG
jgi:probable F420-dependent oxidoreductase